MDETARSIASSDDGRFVSVIVPVYNDHERLLRCLSALESQHYPSNGYEVIVVDNGSDLAVGPQVARFSHVRTLLEATPGSYAARNKGISVARGSVIAFTDSDAVPCRDWLQKGVEALLATPHCGVIGGRIELFCRDPERPTAVELHDLVSAFPQEAYVTTSNFAATANVFTFRSILDSVGLFNAALKSSGDKEWCQRVYQAGYQVRYAPEVRIEHPARHRLRQVYRKILRVTCGTRDLERLRGVGSKNREIRAILWDFLPPVRRAFVLATSTALKGPGQRLRVAAVATVARYFRAWARIQLLFLPPGQIR